MAKDPIELLCTLGPASMNETVIGRLADLGVTLFRINLAHTKVGDLRQTIEFIRGVTSVPVCLDTEGAQIRTGDMVGGSITLRENSVVRAQSRRLPGDAATFTFYPADITKAFEIGDLISIDFNSVLVQVVGFEGDVVLMRVLTGGVAGQNKAVTVERPIALPPLTGKDRAAIALGVEMGIRHYALSFANCAEDVDELRALAGDDAFVISKIESLNGLAHLEDIAARSDALLIDRGDLSRELPIEQIPRVQKGIIRKAREMGVKVYVATNLLESMVTAPTPTRAEVNDVYNTLADGADGLVLAAETAIGAYPVRCATMIVKMVREMREQAGEESHYPNDPFSLLVPPHGGRLIHREAGPGDVRGVDALPVLEVRDTDLMDCEQLAHGTYSPLSGFMDRDALESVLETCRLPDGTVWTMPVLLQAAGDTVRGFAVGDRIALKSAAGKIHAVVDVSDIYRLDVEDVARKWFGTTSDRHPGVARFQGAGDTFIGGAVTLVAPVPSPYTPFALTPRQTRFVFTHKGWTRVVGFHTRNACHRVHEHIQMRALEDTGADGLYINPVIGPETRHDFLPLPILRSYQVLLDLGFYPKERVVLGSLSAYPRLCGPREAVFTALCRKNMGCSHFIIGRDHAGVGDFYPADGDRALFADLGDIGITPVFFNAIGYNEDSRRYQDADGQDAVRSISGTQVRQTLGAGKRLPDWVMRDVVQDMLLDEVAAGRPLFYE